MLVNRKKNLVSHIGAGADMDLVVEMWKNNSPQKQAGFPTIPTT